MSADPSAYSVLGLKPGADFAAVEQAYKALIKQFHPDRVGGDSRRAAEINRAYRELRDHHRYRDDLVFHEDDIRPRKRWPLGALAIVAIIVAVGLTQGSANWWRAPADVASRAAASLDPTAPVARDTAMDDPLFIDAIDEAIGEATDLARSGDEMALAEASRTCHQRMRRDPSLAQLDRCAAFDDAVIRLQDRDPLRDRGPFSELAVTGRQMSSATLLSNDYLAMDGRLDRIRLRVELALVPVIPDLPPATESGD